MQKVCKEKAQQNNDREHEKAFLAETI